jgi:N-acetylneuraminate synthase
MSSIDMGGRLIGADYPPLTIPDIGINHGGSLAVAKQMVDAAYEAGAEVVKHQTHVVEDEMAAAAKKIIPGNADISIYDIMKSCCLSPYEEETLKRYVESKGMIYLSTPFSRAAANFLQDLDVQAYKIGSGECNNYPLVEHIARFGKPVILSTGMNTIESVKVSVEILRKYKVPYALLHCTNVYPTPHRLVRLGAMCELADAFPDSIVGLSDHTTSNTACLGAIALGASIVERHFTDTYDRQGPDIVCSMDKAELSAMLKGAHEMFLCRGGKKGPVEEEQPTIDFAYASVVSTRKINAGEQFTEENLWVKRPGTGELLAIDYPTLLGRVAATDIESDALLKRSDVVW